MEGIISLNDIFRILKKRWMLIIFVTLVAASISGGISYYLLTPQYQASTQILVNQIDSKNRVDFTQLSNNISLINTYSVIIKSPAILEKVVENLELTENANELSKKIRINSQDNSQVFSLTVEYSDADKAVLIVNSVSETFQREIKNIMNVDNVSILAKAKLQENRTPVYPNPILNIAISIVIGLILGIGWSLLLDFMDNTIKDAHDVEDLLEMPLLGSIPKMAKKLEQGNKDFTRKHVRGETIGS